MLLKMVLCHLGESQKIKGLSLLSESWIKR